jgi:hypothetical protein
MVKKNFRRSHSEEDSCVDSLFEDPDSKELSRVKKEPPTKSKPKKPAMDQASFKSEKK